jgi:AraC-like DNA-binding protein
LTARALGQVFGYDARRLARAFRTRFDTSLYEHVHRARVLKGLRLLRRTGANVADVARAVGFRSKATFYRAVMRATGQTPAQYRQGAHARVSLRSH